MYVHKLIDTEADDYSLVKTIAIEHALKGHVVDIMPNTHGDEIWGKILFPDGIALKSPDLRIDGVLWEIESSTNPSNYNNLKHRIGDGSKQANNIILDVGDYDFNEEDLVRLCNGRFKDHSSLQQIKVRTKGKYLSQSRK